MTTVRELLERERFVDAAILRHGFTDYTRDYEIVLSCRLDLRFLSGNVDVHRYQFVGCVEAAYETRVPGNIFAASLSDDFVLSGPDYPDKDDPPGWIWGTRWSCAYPGLEYIADGSRASAWAQRLGRPMHEVNLETNAFQLRLVFADVRYHFEGYDVQREVLGPKQYPLPILDDDVTSDEGVR